MKPGDTARQGQKARTKRMKETAIRKGNRTAKTKMLRIAVEYDPDTPRCGNCASFQKASFDFDRSKPLPARCILNVFTVHPTALCNLWEGFDGTFLEGNPYGTDQSPKAP